MEGTVTEVHVNPTVRPVIAITEVGCLNSASSLDCGLAIEETSNRPILKIFNHHGGTVEEEDTTKKESGKKYLVLRNKKTNKVSVFGTKVVYFKKPDYYKVKTYEDHPLENKDYEFNMVFGTKKATRISKSRNNDTINASTDVFKNISTSSTLLKSSNSQLNEFSIYLPTGCNRFADNIENVYPISTLLLENEIDLMTEYANEVISMLPVSDDNEDLSKFFKANINRLFHKTIQNICLLTYADGLITLLSTKSGDINYRYNEIYPNSQIINDKLMDNFVEYSVTGRDFSSKMKDKAVCHLIIIMILINMNTLDVSWISPFLSGSSQKRLLLLMKVVGAAPLKDDKTKFSFKIPLASLPIYQKQPKRGR